MKEKDMDEIVEYNKERWEELAAANVEFSRPWLDLDMGSARAKVDPENVLKGMEIAGKDVLCLAGGGGQQSSAFAMLGAHVTVFDLSEVQLQRDRDTAEHYGLQVNTIQGDMRDLSMFADASFDIVWHAHSINFVPDAQTVFHEVARVLREGGFYRLSFHNPYIHGVCEQNWNGEGYLLQLPYVEGEVRYATPEWDIYDEKGARKQVKGPKEFRHTLSTSVNGLTATGFVILRVSEDTQQDLDAEPGSWAHFLTVTAPYIAFWLSYQPQIFENTFGNIERESMEQNDMQNIVGGLCQSPRLLSALIDNIPKEMLKVRRIPGKWSIHEHACHLADVQPMLIERLRRFKQEERPVFTPYIPGKTVPDDHLLKMDLAEMLSQFASDRIELLTLAGTFREDIAEKQGVHDEYSQYTPHILLRHILMHDYLHMYRIEKLWLTKEEYLGD
jgi:2-polyprenyl-3-methyl-5-hydroxy-6-metoxy-1,4-benzoquinol methylase/uncharacterized damage-inducible protein DinB